MTTLYLMEEHSFVGKKGRTLVVRQDRETNKSLPLERVTDVLCCGDVSWSGAALRELAEMGISVAYVGPHGEWVGRWEPSEPKTVPLRRAQFRAADDEGQRLAIARAIVAGKLRNSRALLLRARRDEMLEDCEEIREIEILCRRAVGSANVEEARGLEGQAAACYFRAYGRIVSVHGFEFRERVRRPPTDPVNALLSFGYALLQHVASTAVRSVGFDAHVGYLHYDRYGRESLSLDLMEEFRAPIVDALVAALIHKRMVQARDFEQEGTSCRLSKGARKEFIEQFERKLESEVMHPVLRKRVSHRRAIEIQARILAKLLMGEIEAYIAFGKR